jgi:ABC-type bacteriocin/lantibiotic exporter with double-glycine peptidase domain
VEDHLSIDRRPLQQCFSQWTYDERALILRLALASLLSMLLSLAMPRVSQVVFDRALPEGSPRLMLAAAAAALLLAAHSAWLGWLQALMSIDLGIRLERNALTRVVGAMVQSTAEQRKSKNAGWMLTTLNGAGVSAQRYAASQVSLLSEGLSCIGYLISLSAYSPAATAIVVIFNAAIAFVGLSLVRFEAGTLRRALECSSVQQHYLHMLLSRLASLHGLFATERLASRWSHQVAQSAEAQLKSGRVGVLMGMVDNVGSKTLSTGLTLWAIYQCFGRTISLGEMMFLLATAGGLSATLTGVIHAGLGLRALGPYVSRVDDLVKASNIKQEGAEAPLTTDDRILIDRAWFRYSPSDRWILSNYAWEVRRGEVIHLRSASGSGKSTLLRLIAGLLEPSTGTVSVFGLSASEARGLVLYVPQNCELFETSIRENLELLSGATLERIQQVAQLTGLSQMLQRFPMGLETYVAAQGQNLSSGQRQLILLTAAFASARPVLLLDESTSQIDAATRQLCQWDILTKDRTVIRVEHA